jgi:hypothetical protein
VNKAVTLAMVFFAGHAPSGRCGASKSNFLGIMNAFGRNRWFVSRFNSLSG